MSVEERDLRMVIVAFEDAVTWCQTLADLADKLIESAATGRTLPAEDLASARAQIAETRRFVEANEGEVARIRHRAGLP